MIPRKIHQFWTGDVMPPMLASWCAGWESLHPGWEYRLWDTASVAGLDPVIGKLLAKTTIHPAGISDIARVTILLHMGGIYLDTDFQPLRSMEPIIATGVSAFHVLQGGEPSCAVLGACPGHAWMQACRDGMVTMGYTPVPPPWATRMITQAARDCGVYFLPGESFYPYCYWERDKKHDDFPDSYGVHRHHGSWLGWTPDKPKE